MPLKAAITLCLVLLATGHAVELRVATFNIGAHLVVEPGRAAYFDYGLGPPGTPDHDSVREILRRIDADVVALQEIHSADINAGHVDALANGLGYTHRFLSTTAFAFDTNLRVIFFSRFPFLSNTAIASPSGARDLTRLIPAVKIDIPGTTRDPVLIAAHLKSGSGASDLFQRAVEMRRLTDHLNALNLTADDNFLILGDFNLSDSDRTFTVLPPSGLPDLFDLGDDILYPIHYFTAPLDYFSSPAVNRIIPRQLNNSTVTFKSQTSGSESAIDLFMVSPIIGSRPLHTEIYNSALDTSNSSGLPKAGAPLAAGTSTAASDHFAVFGDVELDPALPYVFEAPGKTVSETFPRFNGTYDPYPWVVTGGSWQGVDDGSSTVRGFRSYGPAADPSLGLLPGTAGNTATATLANHSTSVLSALKISYTAEQWRSAFGGTADGLGVELITGGSSRPLPQLTYQPAPSFANGPIPGGNSTVKSMIVTGLSVAPGATFELKFTLSPGPGGGLLPGDVFINEFSYDDNGADDTEFVEIAVGPGYTGPLGNINLLLYNGAGGATYDSHALSSFTIGSLTSSGHRIFSKPIEDIQNGAPDGFALVVNGVVTQFISYEGQFTATAGAAMGMTSMNVGFTQTGSEPVGKSSIGLTGSGGIGSSFNWAKFDGIDYSAGQKNHNQTFTAPAQPQGISIDDLSVTFLSDSDGDGYSDADERVFGTDPEDAESRFSMNLTYGSPTAGSVALEFPTVTGRSYTVEKSTQLDVWDDVETYPGTGSPRIAVMPVDPLAPECFYRIRVTLP